MSWWEIGIFLLLVFLALMMGCTDKKMCETFNGARAFVGIEQFDCISPKKIEPVKKEDCFSFNLHDMNINLGRNTFQLQVYDIRKTKAGKEYILFRDLDNDKGYVAPVNENFKNLESSGLVWIWSKDFYRMRDTGPNDSAGFSRFWYPEKNSIRKGVHCNPMENK